MSLEIGVGLIGYGAIGRVHALCYRMLPLCYPDLVLQPKLVTVQVASERGAEKARRELGNLLVTTRLDELLADPAVAIVDCCAPTGEHAPIARTVLAAGKPLFCEKPLAVPANESRALALLADQLKLQCGVNYHFRFIPALQEAKRWIDAGNLGEVIHFNMRYVRASNLKRDRPVNWRFEGPGSGVLVDLGSHVIDMILHLLGPVAAVAASTRTLFNTRPTSDGKSSPVLSDDAAWLSLELVNGGRGAAHVSKIAPGAADDMRIEAYGTRGSLIFDTGDPNGVILADTAGQRRIATFGKATPPPAYPGSELVTAPLLWHMASLAHYLEALGGSAKLQPNFADGARVDAILFAALESAAQDGVAKSVSNI